MADDEETRRHVLEHLRHVFAQLTQLTVAARALDMCRKMRSDFAPRKRCHRQSRPKRLFHDPPLLFCRPVSPPARSALNNFNTLTHPSPPVAIWPPQVELESSEAARQGGQK